MLRANYVQELESVRENLVQMGETTLALLREALSASVSYWAKQQAIPSIV
jgi:hypothetical protein